MSKEPLMPCMAPALHAYVADIIGKLAERHTRWFEETEMIPAFDDTEWEGGIQPPEEPELLREAFQSGDISGTACRC